MARDSKPAPTMADVARACGVSRMTVSRCLRDDPRQAESTRKRVREFARKLGYRPNPLVATLMTERRGRKGGERGTLAMLWSRSFEPSRNQELLTGVREQCEELGYRFDLIEVDEEVPGVAPSHWRMIRSRGIVSVVLAPAGRAHARIEPDLSGLAVVTIGVTVECPYLHRVVADQFSNTVLAIDRVLARGGRRLGLIMSQQTNERSEERYEGAFLARQANLGFYGHVWKHDSLPFTQEGRENLRGWIEQHGLDAVLSPDQDFLTRVAEVVDVECVTLNASRGEAAFGGVSQDWYQMGQRGAQLATSLARRNQFGPAQNPILTTVRGFWRDGQPEA